MENGKLIKVFLLNDIEVDCINHDSFISEKEIRENIEGELLKVFKTKENIINKLHYIEILKPSVGEPFSAVFFADLDSTPYYYGDKGNNYRVKAMTEEEAQIRMSFYIEKGENLIKQTCKELDLSYKQLGEAIGVKEQSLRNMSSNGKITEQVEKSINLLIENKNLQIQLKDCNILKEALRNLTK